MPTKVTFTLSRDCCASDAKDKTKLLNIIEVAKLPSWKLKLKLKLSQQHDLYWKEIELNRNWSEVKQSQALPNNKITVAVSGVRRAAAAAELSHKDISLNK